MKQNNNKQIHFLAYLNRSGSTLLAKKLNEFKDISVGIELKEKKSAKKFFAVSEKVLDYWLDQVYLDKKFQYWNIDRKELKQKLFACPKPIYFHDFLKVALKLYFKNDPAKIILHKGRYYLNRINEVDNYFPGAKHVFIDRDPRAIYNSQKKSIDSTTKKVMNDDVIRFALGYKRNQKRIKYIQKSKAYKNDLLIIKYENLIRNEEYELDKVVKFFNTSKERKPQNNYFDKIPNEQKYLHENLKKGNLNNRIDAWKKELETGEIKLLNIALKYELLSNNYEIYKYNFFTDIFEFTLIKSILNFYLKYLPKHLIKTILIKLNIKRNY